MGQVNTAKAVALGNLIHAFCRMITGKASDMHGAWPLAYALACSGRIDIGAYATTAIVVPNMGHHFITTTGNSNG